MTAIATNTPLPRPKTGIKGPVLGSALGLLLLCGALGGWAATARIDGAILGAGSVALSAKPQLVQSLDGGVLREILVKNGDRVEAGEVLLRLDDTLASASLGIARERLAHALALRARLEAEQLGLPAPDFGYDALPVAIPDTSGPEAVQTRIFQARQEILAGGRARLTETLDSHEAQIRGIEGQKVAAEEQVRILKEDLERMQTLDAEGLTIARDMNDVSRALAETTGQVSALESQVAALRIAMQDAELAVVQEEDSFREQVATDLQEAEARVDELVLEIVTREAELARMEILAPADGVVHGMQVATVGGVAPQGQTLLEVLPVGQGLEFQVRIDPRDIDRVHPEQGAEILISSLDPRTTPRLKAEVTQVSADAFADERTGLTHYEVTLVVPPEELARLGDEVNLVPGMPVQAFLEMGERSVLEYLVQPVAVHLRDAFREE